MTTKMTSRQKKRVLILFYAETGEPGWKERFNPSGSLTNYLKEHRCFSTQPDIPQPGYRFFEYTQLPEHIDPLYPNSDTHWREGNWVVSRTEGYKPLRNTEWDEVYFCYCRYQPIQAEWQKINRLEQLQGEGAIPTV